MTKKKVINEILSNNSFFSNFSQRDRNMAQTFLELDTTDCVYLGQFGAGHTQLDNTKWLTGFLNSLEEYHSKILVINMYYGDSFWNENNTLKNYINSPIDSCPNFLCRIYPSDNFLIGFLNRGQWLFYFKNEKSYTIRDHFAQTLDRNF